MTLISLCMIVRNEAETLPRALANLGGFYDEFIVVDTGSTDNTPEIARSYGARVLAYDWQYPGHKGEARNVGIDTAVGEWIVVLDADEVIRQPAELRAWLQQAPADLHGVHPLFENYDEQGQCILRWHQLRIFRRGLYRYRYREHELPKPCVAQDYHETLLATVFEHRPPAGRAAGKQEAMLARLRADVEEHPNDPHPAYFLHRQYGIASLWAECIEAGRHYLSIAGNNDRCECYGNLAVAYQALGNTQEAIHWLYRAAAEQPARRIWWVRMADLYMASGQWNLALAHLRLASELWPNPHWQWEPQIDAQLYESIARCQQAIAHGGHEH